MKKATTAFLIIAALWLSLLAMLSCGCGNNEKRYEHMTLECGVCHRVVYDGKAQIESSGFRWPCGKIERHKPWDPLCVSKHDPKNKRAREIGETTGYDDACNKRIHPTFDGSYARQYQDGYEAGWARGRADNERRVP